MTEQEIEDLKRRVEQLEKALWAVAAKAPICCDEHGRLQALKTAKEIFDRQQYPNAKSQ